MGISQPGGGVPFPGFAPVGTIVAETVGATAVAGASALAADGAHRHALLGSSPQATQAITAAAAAGVSGAPSRFDHVHQFTGLPTVPSFLLTRLNLYSGAALAVGVLTALRAYIMTLEAVMAPMTIAAIRGPLTVQNGNYDVGLYSTTDWITFTRLYSLGLTAVPAGGAEITWASPAFALTPGTQYFVAFITDGIATVGRIQANASSPWNPGYFEAEATALLPASIVAPTALTTNSIPALVCTISTGDPAA